MTTAENLSVEIRYQKLKVNFNYCFSHGIFQNQVYNFFCIISWVVSHNSFIVRFVCFSSQNFLSFECLRKIRFFFTDFRKAIARLWVNLHFTSLRKSTLHKSRQTLSYMWKFTWEKEIGERKVHNPVKYVLFINISKDLLYYILPR